MNIYLLTRNSGLQIGGYSTMTIDGKPWPPKRNSTMDEKTNQLVEDAERHLKRYNNEEFGDLARDDVPALIAAVREQSARADRAEQARDEQTKKWMQAQLALDNEKESHRRTIGELGVETDRRVKLEKKRDAIRESLTKLEKVCEEIVNLRDEAAEDPTTVINRSLQKLDIEIVQMSVMLP